jgi:hypothetical protein
MIEAKNQHHISSLGGSDEHISEETLVFAYVEECKSVIQSIFLNEKTYLVGWLRLKIAVLDVENLVKETSYVETKTVFLLYAQCISILIVKDPAALREGELQFVTIVCGFV